VRALYTKFYLGRAARAVSPDKYKRNSVDGMKAVTIRQATGFDRLDWLRMHQSLWPDRAVSRHLALLCTDEAASHAASTIKIPAIMVE